MRVLNIIKHWVSKHSQVGVELFIRKGCPINSDDASTQLKRFHKIDPKHAPGSDKRIVKHPVATVNTYSWQ